MRHCEVTFYCGGEEADGGDSSQQHRFQCRSYEIRDGAFIFTDLASGDCLVFPLVQARLIRVREVKDAIEV